MHSVLLSLASNCEQTKNLPLALQRLGQILHIQKVTEAIWTEPYQSEKGKVNSEKLYLNQLVYAETTLDADQLEKVFKQIEKCMGRTTNDRRNGIVRIDIDLLQHDTERYHLKDWERDYIKRLLE